MRIRFARELKRTNQRQRTLSLCQAGRQFEMTHRMHRSGSKHVHAHTHTRTQCHTNSVLCALTSRVCHQRAPNPTAPADGQVSMARRCQTSKTGARSPNTIYEDRDRNGPRAAGKRNEAYTRTSHKHTAYYTAPSYKHTSYRKAMFKRLLNLCGRGKRIDRNANKWQDSCRVQLKWYNVYLV